MSRYQNFNSEQFLNDPDFIQWIKYGKPEQALTWQSYLGTNPANLNEFQRAVSQLKLLLSAEPIQIPDGEEQRIWVRITDTLRAAGQAPLRSIRNYRWLSWAAAAVLVILSGVYFFRDRKQNLVPNTVIASNMPTLTLSDNTIISLDSNVTGVIPKQGKSEVKKMKHAVVYQQQGIAEKLEYNTISTPRGGQYQVLLADGTKVWLNAMSRLRYPVAFAAGERRVEVDGEAWFQVVKDDSKPFIVQKNNLNVVVLGTDFNVQAYDNDSSMLITLKEGKIRVKDSLRSIVIMPGQQAKIKNGKTTVLEAADMNKVMAWMNGFFYFENDDLPSVMRQLSRWYDIEVRYEAQIPDQLFAGKIARSVPLQEILETFTSYGIRYRFEGKVVTILP